MNNPENIRYVWNGSPEQLNELANQLRKQRIIKRKRDFVNLFEKPHAALKVNCNKNYKPHLAYLLYRLFEEGYFCIRGSKGYFTHAENHFTDMEGNGFNKNTLRKLSSKINKNKKVYKDVISEIEGVLEKI